MVSVLLRNGESQRHLSRRFRKKVARSGIKGEVRKRRWYVSKNKQCRMDKKKAIRRYKQRKEKYFSGNNGRRRR